MRPWDTCDVHGTHVMSMITYEQLKGHKSRTIKGKFKLENGN